MKKRIILLIIIILGIISLGGIYYSYSIHVKEYSNSNFKIKYDTTWKVVEKKDNLKLLHKKTGSILEIQCKVIDINYLDVSLNDLIEDIMTSVEKQNSDYKLIDYAPIRDFKYEAYSYLYEKDMEQVLVNVYKHDNKLIVIYYEALSESYDIVLDSVDEILKSLEIISGEKVN